MLYTKFQQNILSGSAEKVEFLWFSYFWQQQPFLILNQAEFQDSEALQPRHAACEI